MISIKKYLDRVADVSAEDEPKTDLSPVVLQSYRSTLLAIGDACVRSCPTASSDLRQGLANVVERLGRNLNRAGFREIETEVGQRLQRWATASADYLRGKTDEIKELLVVLATAAETFAQRDARHGDRLLNFSTELNAISSLDDLSQIRGSLLQKASELKQSVSQMLEENQETIAALHTRIVSYENKLRDIEALSMRDSLTGLGNRRYLEERIESCITRQKGFSIALLDLNGFKQVNDQYGHETGDELLQQFASELKGRVRSDDVVGRWGGDEFLVLLESDLNGAMAQMKRTEQWVSGEYKIRPADGQQAVSVKLNVAVGIAEWMPGESAHELIRRADKIMYQHKNSPAGKRSSSLVVA